MINDIKNIQANLGKSVVELKAILDSHLNTLPQQKLDEINELRIDMNEIVSSVKSGNVDAINKIRSKHGNNNR